MSVIEVMAFVLVLAVLVKTYFVFKKPKSCIRLLKRVYSNNLFISMVALILAAVSLYFLVISGITILEIFSVILFLCFLCMMGFSPYSKNLIKFVEEVFKDKKFLKKSWVFLLIWILLVVWALFELLY